MFSQDLVQRAIQLMMVLVPIGVFWLIYSVIALFRARDEIASRLAGIGQPALEETEQPPVPPGVLTQQAKQIVQEIQEQIATYRIDLDFLLTAPGLFDTSFTPARKFWEAMTAWQDHGHQLTGADALQNAKQLQRYLEDAVAAARASGLDHLPSPTRTGLKTAKMLATKAACTTNDHEREAFMTKVAQILSELNLAFLGREAVAAIMSPYPAADLPKPPAVESESMPPPSKQDRLDPVMPMKQKDPEHRSQPWT